MRKLFFVFLVALLIAGHTFSQTQFEVLKDKDGGKMLKGIISREQLQSDTAFKWYGENLKDYTLNKDAISGLRKNADSIQLVVFMGTWCDDSHFVIPKLYSLLDQAGFSNDHVTLLAVDRQKKTISHLTEALNIINVPTIIVLKNGKELGRVVEYGKYGTFDKELGEIVNQLN